MFMYGRHAMQVGYTAARLDQSLKNSGLTVIVFHSREKENRIL